MLAHVAQRIADLLLTVRIKARRIKETDTRVIRLAKQYLRIIKRNTLDWQRAKSIFIDDNIRLSKGNLCAPWLPPLPPPYGADAVPPIFFHALTAESAVYPRP